MRELLVKIAVATGTYKGIVEIINRVKQFFQARRLRKRGLSVLIDADKAFTEAGMQLFPAFGTQLGFYRDKGFIKYDFDIDTGVLAEADRDTVHNTMQRHGFRLNCQTFVREDDGTETVTEENYIKNGVSLDVFYYFREKDMLFAYCPQKHEYKDWREANRTDGFPIILSYVPVSDFERRQVMGYEFYMPVNIEEWLRAMYSDTFMTPIKNWYGSEHEHKTLRTTTPKRCYRKYPE